MSWRICKRWKRDSLRMRKARREHGSHESAEKDVVRQDSDSDDFRRVQSFVHLSRTVCDLLLVVYGQTIKMTGFAQNRSSVIERLLGNACKALSGGKMSLGHYLPCTTIGEIEPRSWTVHDSRDPAERHWPPEVAGISPGDINEFAWADEGFVAIHLHRVQNADRWT